MSDNGQDVIDRIERYHCEQGLTQRALAEKAGLSVTQMNRVMTRQRKLTAAELGIIAEALGVSASELLGDADRRLSFAARVGRAERAPELEGPFRRAEELLKTRELLDSVVARTATRPRPDLPAPDASTLHKAQGQAMALELRKALGFGNDGIDDLEELVARFGLEVSTQPLPEGLHGLLVTDQSPADSATSRVAVALLNAYDTAGKRRFTLAHELGHLVFADGSLAIADYDPRAKQTDGRWTPERLVELRADTFAAHLLAPDAVVHSIAEELDGPPRAGKLAWAGRLIVEIALQCGISFETAGNRARDAEALTEGERRRVSQRGVRQAFRDAGRSDLQGRVLDTVSGVEPPAAMLEQALIAYQTEVLGLRPLATLYDVSPAEMENLRQQLWDAGWVPESTAGAV